MTKTLKLRKSLREIMDDVSGYTIQITAEDTMEELSMLLINVKLTKDTETALTQRKKDFEVLKTQLIVFEAEKMDIEVVLPAILEKKDFTKAELTKVVK